MSTWLGLGLGLGLGLELGLGLGLELGLGLGLRFSEHRSGRSVSDRARSQRRSGGVRPMNWARSSTLYLVRIKVKG